MPGKIEVICGPMFSGKTETLIERITRAKFRKQDYMVFKPKIDNRYSNDSITSHNGRALLATGVSASAEIDVAIQNYQAANAGRYPDIVGVEEIQFLDEDIVQLAYDLKCVGCRVILSGLDMDWQGVPFAVTSTLMALADSVDKLKAACVVCGDDASHSYLKNKNGDRIQVGATDKYEARCFNHWKD